MNAPAAQHGLGKGIALIVLAFLCVAVMSAFGKAAGGVPIGQMVFFQSGISLVLLAPLLLRGGLAPLRTHRLPMHLLRAFTGLASQALFFIAVQRMSLVDDVLLTNTAPLFIPLVALPWVRTPVGPAMIASLLVGFAGVVLILRPSAELMHNPAALLALGAGACSAMALVSVNQLAPTDSSQAILFYYFLISTIAAAPFAAMHWCVPTQTEWWLLGGVGVGMALAQLFIIMAYRHASAAQLAPFNYSVVVFSGVIGWIVWHEALDMTALLGILLVCAGGIASIRAAPHIHGPSALRSTTALSRRDHAS